ncbi:uncharacterized protein LOC144344811 [Saccoglossus kowalevskii]
MHNLSRVPQQWNVAKGSNINAEPINHVIVAKPSEQRKRKQVLCQIDRCKRLPKVTSDDIETLKKLKGTPVSYMVSNSTPVKNTPLSQV